MTAFPNKRHNKQPRSHITRLVATTWGVTADYVRKVMRGERSNPGILRSYRLFEKKQQDLEKEFKKTAKRGKSSW